MNRENKFSCVCRGGGNNRVTLYDWLRVIATIFVVIGHSSYLNIETIYGGVIYTLPDTLNAMYDSLFLTWCRGLSDWVYGFHMPLFFMLSGATLALKPIKSFDEILRSKIKRLLIPYFVYGWLFMLPIKRLGSFYDNESLKFALKAFLSGQESGHLWFLIALFWCIIIFVILKKILLKWNVNSIYGMLLLAGFIQFIHSYIPIDIFRLKTGLKYIFYFALGYTFELDRRCSKKWSVRKKMFAFVTMFAIEVLHSRYDILNSFFVIIIGAFLTYMLSDLCNCIFKNICEKQWWQILIRNLFYIYLFHDPMEYIVVKIFMTENWLSSAVGCVAYTAARTVLVFGISIMLGEMIRVSKSSLRKVL